MNIAIVTSSCFYNQTLQQTRLQGDTRISLNMRQTCTSTILFCEITWVNTHVYKSALRNKINIFSSKIHITKDMHDKILRKRLTTT